MFRRCNHASFFFLDGFLTSSVIQSASFSLGKDGELPLASRTATWKEDHSSATSVHQWIIMCRVVSVVIKQLLEKYGM